MRFRPCIDLHNGRVKQIVGSTLTGNPAGLVTNFETDRPSAEFADMYRADGLSGGHVIMLGPGNETAACEALAAFPGGMHVGGGITPDNAPRFLDAGASHVIVTSYVFRNGRVDEANLQAMVDCVGSNRLVLDLSCTRVEERYFITTDRWQKVSSVEITGQTLRELAGSCAEFLVHAAHVEGKQQGIDEDLVELLGGAAPIPITYAGGVVSVNDLDRINILGRGRVDATIGSALDIFGGKLPYRDVVDWHLRHQG